MLNFLVLLVLGHAALSHSNMIDAKVLNVGKELKKEILPLHMGSCVYQLQGLQSDKWYEVKISYPASIPAAFSIRLRRGKSDLNLNVGRKLLNTEKLIFKANSLDLLNDQGGLFVEVNVDPEGVVAIPGVHERKYVVFNIVCDELLLGIPYEAWFVVMLVVLCLGVAFVVPSFLPPYLLAKNQKPHGVQQVSSKDS